MKIRLNTTVESRGPRAEGQKCVRLSTLDSRLSTARSGVALIITLILLSVVTFMAVAFLSLSQRERGAVATVTDTAGARMAADTALANAEAQIIANVLSTTNPYNFGLLVSTNYVNPAGFQTGISSFTNVNYFYANGGSIASASLNDFLQNLTNLWYSPRPPVFIPNLANGGTDFRYYLDLNRNGQDDPNGRQLVISPNFSNPYYDTNGNLMASIVPGNTLSNIMVGDPEWIGVLERPDAPYGPNNNFIARYAFIAVPVGNTLDLNAIHNQALTRSVSDPADGNDGYFRNQGVGSWEINLAAFLADLNTNEWDNILAGGVYQYRQVNTPSFPNAGPAFYDAYSLLRYRYNTNYPGLASVNQLFGGLLGPFGAGPIAFGKDGIDGYSDGPLQTTFDTNADFLFAAARDNTKLFWVGADNTNHFFTHQDLFDPAKTQPDVISPTLGFTDRLLQAGTNNNPGGPSTNVSTYNRYTFYRLLSQLGTDTTPDSGRMNLNYDNLDPGFNGFLNTNGTTSATNFVPWQPLAFFTNAADRLLRTYTTEWRNGNPTNFAATFYAVPSFNFDPTNWANYPAFGIGRIPVLVSNQFVYSSAENRLLQLAANMGDATRTNFYPSVFRPLFSRDADGLGTNVYITGYTNVAGVAFLTNDFQLAQPIDIEELSTMGGQVINLATNVYGVPWIIGAKKGFHNFNQFTMQNVVVVERKLQVTRQTLDGVISTNQMYIFSVSNSLGAELWNSYNSNYVSVNASSPALPQIQCLVRDNISMVLTNDAFLPPMLFPPKIINGGFTNTFSVSTWPGSAPWNADAYSGQPRAGSFFIPLNPAVSTVVLLTNSVYYYGPGSYIPPLGGGPFPGPGFIPQYLYPSNYLDHGTPQLPHFGLLTTNRLQVVILDGTNVIDYAHFAGPNSSRDINAELRDPDSFGNARDEYMWSTNAYFGGPTPYGIVNQINYSSGLPDPTAPAMGTIEPSWNPGNKAFEQDFFAAFFNEGQPYSRPSGGTILNTNLSQQAPFSPIRTCYEYISWQANDPLVHYLASDLNYTGQDTTPPTGIQKWYSDAPLPRPVFNTLNQKYQPWGRKHVYPGSDSDPSYNLMIKDPLVWQSDNWDFPTNKFPTVGWLGRVHRGTPWQTVYLKASGILGEIQGGVYVGTNTWVNWTGDSQLAFGQYFDAVNSTPAQDRWMFDLFTTAFNDNASRGTLSVNVGPTNANLAAWSALLSGIVVLTNNSPNPAIGVPPTNSWFTINPAGVYNPALLPAQKPAIVQIVQGINQARMTLTNADGLVGTFEHVGDIFRAPQFTEQSPFLNWNNGAQQQYGINDEMYEWLPQQIMSLLRVSDSPRYVIYCYGQTLKPAPNGIYNGSGPFFQMVTNYQVVAETATRAVVRFDSMKTNVVGTNFVFGGINWFSMPYVTNNHAVIENFNPLPPD